MDDPLSLTGFGFGFVGCFLALLTRLVPMWTVSGALSDNTTDSVSLHWDGLWVPWDQKDDGSLHCHFIQAALHLSGNFRSWRALITSSICTGFAASIIYFAGRLKWPKRCGVVFVVSGLLLLVVASWVSKRSTEALRGAILLQREWGPALYTAWIGTVVLSLGGGVLVSTYWLSPRPSTRSRPEDFQPTPMTPGFVVTGDPLNTAYRNDYPPYYPTTSPY